MTTTTTRNLGREVALCKHVDGQLAKGEQS